MLVFWGLMLFTFLTFVQPQEFIPGLRGQPVVAITLGLVGIVWGGGMAGDTRMDFGKALQNKLMLLFWVMVVLSTMNVGWMEYTYATSIEWGKIVLIYFLIISIVDTPQKLRTMLWVIVVSMAVTGMLGILQYYGIDYTGLGTHLGGRIRGVGIFGTNQLAYALCFCMPLLLGLLITTRSVMAKAWLIIILCCYCYGVYLTQSRGGLLCLVAIFLMLFSFFSRKKTVKIIGTILCLLLFVGLVKFAPRFSSTLEYESDGSALGRLDAWGNGLIALKEHPLLGIGKGQFTEYFGIAAHNSFIESVTELGLPGLFIWLAFFYYSLKALRTIGDGAALPEKREFIVFAKILQISLYAYLIGSYFSASAYYIPLYMLIAITVILQRLSNMFCMPRALAFVWKDLINIAAIEMAILIIIRVML